MPETKDPLFEGLQDFILGGEEDGLIFVDPKDGVIEPTKKTDKKEDEDLIEIDPLKPAATTSADDEEEDEEEDREDKGDDKNEDTSIFKPLAAYLKEEEILPGVDLDKFDGTAEGLKNAIAQELEEWKQGYLDSLPPVIKELAKNYEDGVPLDELISIKSNQIRYESIDDKDLEEDESLQESIVRNNYKATTKWTDERIEKEIKKLKDRDELHTEAKDGLESLKEFDKKREIELAERAKADAKARAKEAEENYKKLNDTVTTVKEIIPGVKIGDKERKQLLESMTKPVGYTDDGRPVSKVMEVRAKDPLDFEMKLHYFVQKGFFDGKFEAIENKVKTKALTELEQATSANKKFKGGKDTIQNPAASEDILKAFKSAKNI